MKVHCSPQSSVEIPLGNLGLSTQPILSAEHENFLTSLLTPNQLADASTHVFVDENSIAVASLLHIFGNRLSFLGMNGPAKIIFSGHMNRMIDHIARGNCCDIIQYAFSSDQFASESEQLPRLFFVSHVQHNWSFDPILLSEEVEQSAFSYIHTQIGNLAEYTKKFAEICALISSVWPNAVACDSTAMLKQIHAFSSLPSDGVVLTRHIKGGRESLFLGLITPDRLIGWLLWVEPAHRGEGVARRLILKALHASQCLKYQSVADATNLASIRSPRGPGANIERIVFYATKHLQ